jgi:hypothetical protein
MARPRAADFGPPRPLQRGPRMIGVEGGVHVEDCSDSRPNPPNGTTARQIGSDLREWDSRAAQ